MADSQKPYDEVGLATSCCLSNVNVSLAPEGSARYKLEIVFKKLWDCKSLPVKDSCAFGGTDIKLGDFGTGGYRFCCNGQIPEGHVFRTTGSLAYVGLEAVFWFHSFELEFRRVLA
ncbi:hypothetical protein L596_030251 [Steinernema carpocapsae]|uniref:Uncharacterized protein n=1 Tax=Steinernema carpocapsae TaxID=34508 RepID=A0A4U5LS68_STECR|nr:hypothetical protein L596_030251 [Steinernema carpocapsae]